ncbi:MAG: hypothetical protein U9R05_01050 [Chloroflexota bacterium]|nr:hypothetical protein [Chloroflexota bacterium]
MKRYFAFVSSGVLIAGCGLILLTLCVLLVGVLVYRTISSENHFRAALPPDARNVQDGSIDLFPDWEYYLKAEISQETFDGYVQDLGLYPCWDQPCSWVGWHTFSSPAWWDPTEDISQTYCTEDGDVWTLAKYEAGQLYLRAFSH